jgi:hypothetical protein
MSATNRFVPSVLLAIGIAAGGFLAGDGFARAREGDRYVTVKGISERPAKADLAIWPLRLSAADDDLARANAQLQASVVKVQTFLRAHQIDPSEAALQDFSVSDASTNQYGNSPAGSRYVIHETMVIRSTQPDVVLAASQRIAELVTAGVVLASGSEVSGAGGPTFVFSGLNKLKPEMIAEATARAREAAEQFARDSHSAVGAIRQANQGVFEILPRDQADGITEASQIEKTVRVVSTVEYFLR